MLLVNYYKPTPITTTISRQNLSMSMPRLEGKVAIITGAASGIDEVTAKLFAEHGAFVVIADIQDELGLKVVASIGPDKASYKYCDVRNEKQVEETVAFTIDKYGSLDIMYSNAGVMAPPCSILQMNIEEFDNTIAINLCGSVSSTLGGNGPHSYTTSKHGLLGIVRSAASELGKHGIGVNCVSPYAVDTPLVFNTMAKLSLDPRMFETARSAMANLKGIDLNCKHVM
ncbi:unnamed protein product [Ilex paraguariensis]|uniref:Uncharacterized protein n=1 Tax=Ilex paraguariensis TaxID=185542 RepID=A0ABC8UGQ7_9AQUA